MEKILILVFDTRISENSIELCIKILQCFKPLIHILSPVDRYAVTRLASNEGIKEADAREQMLNEAYKNLYHFEDMFNRHDLHVTVTTKEMRLPEELLVEIRRTNPGMLVIVGKIESQVMEFLHGSFRRPLFILPRED